MRSRSRERAQARRASSSLTASGRVLAPAALVASLCGWVLGGAFTVLAATLGGALLVAWIATRRRVAAVHVAPPPPARAAVGETQALPLHLTHRGGPRVRALALRTCTDGGGARAGGYLAELAAGERRTVRIARRVLRRGLEERLVIEIATAYPFGLVESRRRLELPVELLGLPRTGRFGRRIVGARGREQLSATARNAVGAGEEPAGIREWRRGERARRIHWRATARRQELVLRRFEARQSPPLRLILSRRPQTGGPFLDGRASFEAAVSLTATLAREELSDGRRVGLATVGAGADPVRETKTRAGRAGLASHLVTLAFVERVGVGGRHEESGASHVAALAGAVRRARARGEEVLVVVAGGAATHELEEAWSQALGVPVLDVDAPHVAGRFRRQGRGAPGATERPRRARSAEVLHAR